VALAVNLLLLLVLLGIGAIPMQPPKGGQTPLVVNLSSESASEHQAEASKQRIKTPRKPKVSEVKPVPKPKIALPTKPTIAPPRESPWVEMSHDQMAAADIRKLPKAARGSGGDSEVVGRAPNGDVLYAAEWARRPTDAELGGYRPPSAPDGYGLIACRTAPENRVEDCIELDQYPHGSHLASAVRQAAWQFRVRPPRKNGRPLIGSWVEIRIDYISVDKS
jgi:protein TonB